MFTQEFAHVMGGAKSQLFKKFVALCCQGEKRWRRGKVGRDFV